VPVVRLQLVTPSTPDYKANLNSAVNKELIRTKKETRLKLATKYGDL